MVSTPIVEEVTTYPSIPRKAVTISPRDFTFCHDLLGKGSDGRKSQKAHPAALVQAVMVTGDLSQDFYNHFWLHLSNRHG
jgi:hypothetical protein